MSAMDAVNSYYDAWRAGKGDFSAVPLAPMTAAEVLTVRDGLLVHGELIYDAQEFRAAMAAGG